MFTAKFSISNDMAWVKNVGLQSLDSIIPTLKQRGRDVGNIFARRSQNKERWPPHKRNTRGKPCCSSLTIKIHEINYHYLDNAMQKLNVNY